MLNQQKKDQEEHIVFMQLAIELAKNAFEKDEVPVGAVIVEKKNIKCYSWIF